MRRLVAIVALALAGNAQSAPQRGAFIYPPQTQDGVTVVCADVTQDGFREAELWVTGFVSGMNAATHQIVGHSTTTSGLLGEVKLHCARHPSDTLMNAVYKTCEQMKAAGK